MKMVLECRFDAEEILESLQCYKDKPGYDAYRQMLDQVVACAEDLLKPMGYAVQGETNTYLEGTFKGALYCIVSMAGIEEKVNAYFDDFDYLSGMMLNGVADAVLFNASAQMYEIMKLAYEAEGIGLTKRYEPGTGIVPVDFQKQLFEQIRSESIPVTLNESFMMVPGKSISYFYGLMEGRKSDTIDHDCSNCGKMDCPSRKANVQVLRGEEIHFYQVKRRENLLDFLRREGLFQEAPCSGKGLCGKCKVVVRGHKWQTTAQERLLLTAREIEADVVLACEHQVEEDLTVVLKEQTGDIHVLGDFAAFTLKSGRYGKGYGIGIDIGTTTIAMHLVSLKDHSICAQHHMENPQKPYGADVISRIQYQKETDAALLTGLIRERLSMGIDILCKKAGVQGSSGANSGDGQQRDNRLKEIVVAGNTTMIYLLLGMDAFDLSVSPFETVPMSSWSFEFNRCFDGDHDASVSFMPWISAYVGGDIVSGLYALDLASMRGNNLLIDIGTNGEIALVCNGEILAAATAAGPAFEGQHIRHGMGSFPGAVCKAKWDEGTAQWQLTTIQDAPPAGICGSGLLDLMAGLLDRGMIDETGYIPSAEAIPICGRDGGEIAICRDDVRQVQLAKAAIYGGIMTLLEEKGLTEDQIDRVFLAGGFGQFLSVESAVRIGMIPEGLKDRCRAVGNTSLAGTIRRLCETEAGRSAQHIAETAVYLELSCHMGFYDKYIDAMHFMTKGASG